MVSQVFASAIASERAAETLPIACRGMKGALELIQELALGEALVIRAKVHLRPLNCLRHGGVNQLLRPGVSRK